MKRLLSAFLVAVLALGAGILSRPVLAAEPDSDEEGVSAYSVARLKIFQGTAWVRSPDSGEWEEANTNSPVTERSRVNIPEKSEAELQFHGGQFVLLTSGTEVDIPKFDEANTVFGLRSGEIRFDLPPDDFSPVKVMIPKGGKVKFNVPGRYWLTVQESGQTRLVVRSGEGSVSTAKGDFGVKAGEQATIGQDVRIAAYSGKSDETYTPPPPMTEEERQADVPPAAAYELRDYGDWVSLADYGWVWQPRVAAGWSPYYYGQWVWVSPYGWTWVSNEPWGWYPYHFGWWVSDPFFGWVWCPFHSFVSVGFVFGNFHFAHFHRNVFFSPATVRFVRNGGFVRWVPLRPGERFVRPAFTRSDARLARWERPLERGSVFVRSQGGGKGEWRDWTTVRGGRNTVLVKERASRPGAEGIGRPGGPRSEERSTVRPPADRSGPGRQERMQQRGPERMPQREFRGREGRPGDRGGAPDRWRQGIQSTANTERARPPRPEWRGEPSVRTERARPAPLAGYSQPNRGFQRSEGGGGIGGRMPESRGDFRGPSVRNQWSEGNVDRGWGGGGDRFNFGGRGVERGAGGGRVR